MATQIADLFIKLGVQTEDLKGATNEIKKSLGEVNQSAAGMKSGLSGFGDSFKSAMANAEDSSKGLATGLFGAGAAILGLSGYAMSLAGDLEMTKAAFETMLGSVEASDKMIREITDFAAKTPFEMQGLNDAATKLLSVGTAADDIVPTLNMLGDISMGNAQKFASITHAFSQMSSSGKMTGEDFNQLLDQGFNPLKIISEQTGRSMVELKDAMADGAITFEMVKNAMASATSEGGQFHNMLLNQSQTLPALMTTLQDTIVLSMQAIGTSLIEATNIKAGLISLTEGVTAIGNKLVEFFNLIADVGLNEALKQVFSPYVVTAIVAIGGALLASLVPAMVAWATSAYAAAAATLAALQPFLLAGAAIGAVAYVIYNNWDSIVKLFNDYVKPVLVGAADILKKFFDPIVKAAKDAWKTLTDLWRSITDIFSNNEIDTGSAVGAFSLIIDYVKTYFGVIADIIGAVWNSVVIIFQGAAKILGNIIGGFINLITGNWRGFGENISNIIGAVWGVIKQIFYNGVSAALDIASRLFGWIPGANDKIEAMRNGLKNLIPQEPVNASKEIDKAVSNTATSMNNTKTASVGAAAAVEDFGKKGEAAGGKVVTAMNGASSAANAAAASVSKIIGDISANLAAGERELKFKLSFTDKAAVQDQIKELETALGKLANETKIDINDERVVNLQSQLTIARARMLTLVEKEGFDNKLKDILKDVQDVGTASATQIGNTIEKLKEFYSEAPESEKSRLKEIIKDLETTKGWKDMAEDAEDAFDAYIDTIGNYSESVANLLTEFVAVDAALGNTQNGFLSKMALLDTALANGEIDINDYNDLVDALKTQYEQGRDKALEFANALVGIARTQFPEVFNSFDNLKSAVASFKSAFKGDNEKSVWENIGDGLGFVAEAMSGLDGGFENMTKAAAVMVVEMTKHMGEVGKVVYGVIQVLEAFGIDVTGVIQRAIDKLLEFLGLGRKGGGDVSPFSKMFDDIQPTVKAIMDLFDYYKIIGREKIDFPSILSQITDPKNRQADAGAMQKFVENMLRESLVKPFEQYRPLTNEQMSEINRLTFGGYAQGTFDTMANASKEYQRLIEKYGKEGIEWYFGTLTQFYGTKGQGLTDDMRKVPQSHIDFIKTLNEQIVYLMKSIIPFIKSLYDTSKGGGGYFDPEQLKKFNARMDELAQAYSGSQLWDLLASEFGEAITRFVLGERPVSAKERAELEAFFMGLVHDFGLQEDTSDVSAWKHLYGLMVNKFGEYLVRMVYGTLDEFLARLTPSGQASQMADDGILSSIMGSMSGMLDSFISSINAVTPNLEMPSMPLINNEPMQAGQQVIYLSLDGRTITETVVQGMPDYIRLNLGNGY